MASWLLSAMILASGAVTEDCTIVYFGSQRCQPCEQIEPSLQNLLRQGWDIRHVDAPSNPELAKRFRIRNLPTVVILKDGEELDRVIGAAPYEQLLRRFQRAAGFSPTNQDDAGTTSPTVRDANTTGQQASAAANHSGDSPPRPLVRGQSPGEPTASQPSANRLSSGPASGGFPMLASNRSFPSAAERNHLAEQGQLDAARSRSTSAGSRGEGVSMTSLSDARSANPQPAAEPSRSQATIAHAATDGGSHGEPPALPHEQAQQRARKATVRIRVDEQNSTAFGTGTVIDVHGEEALVLTCGHLFRDMREGSQLTLDLFAGTSRETNVLAQVIDFKADGEDIGLVSFRLPTAIEPVEILPRAERPEVGQQVFSLGCDHGEDPTLLQTHIKSIDRYLGPSNLEIDGAPAVGRSGGGLFDRHGRLIGVCNAADAADNEGIYAAAPVVYDQIERLGLAHLFDQSQAAPQGVANQPQQASTRSSEPQLASARGGVADAQQSPVGGPARSGSRNNSVNSANPLSGGGAGDIEWPDSGRSLPADLIGASSAPSTAGDSGELICIVKDSAGRNRVVTITDPSASLLEQIESYAQQP